MAVQHIRAIDEFVLKARSVKIDDKHYLCLKTGCEYTLVEKDESKEPKVEPARVQQQQVARTDAELLVSRFDGLISAIPH